MATIYVMSLEMNITLKQALSPIVNYTSTSGCTYSKMTLLFFMAASDKLLRVKHLTVHNLSIFAYIYLDETENNAINLLEQNAALKYFGKIL